MVSTYTPNIQLEEPARGDQVGIWDTPVNGNMTLIDSVVGGISLLTLNNSPVVLSGAQFQSRTLTFVSTLTGNVAITFPTSFVKDYIIFNLCTGSSAFTITLQTTGAGGQVVCAPPGESIQVINGGRDIIFLNLGRIGSYWDYAGSSVPNWVSGCSIPPYLNCDATTFSSATFPVLATILGSTTLPDRRGTAGYTLNQGTGRLTAASGGLDGNTIRATKVTDSVTLGTSNLPAYTPGGTVASAGTIPVQGFAQTGSQVNDHVSLGSNNGGALTLPATITSTFGGTPQGGVSDPVPAIGTGTVYGICMIRSA